MSSRDAFLSRVRQAVKDGNQAGDAAPIPERGDIGYQGGGDDRLATFLDRARGMGMSAEVVTSRDELLTKIDAVLVARNARQILVGRGSAIELLNLSTWIESSGRVVIAVGRDSNDRQFDAEASITEVAGAIAETGSLVIATGPQMSRLESLIAPVHIAIVRPQQLQSDVFDVFTKYSAQNLPPSNLVFITGPSKTGDIELKLVTGVHGPGEVFIFVLDDSLREPQ